MSSSIVLYDLDNRARPHTSWSYNVWKTRLALNYKNVPYTTAWTDHSTLGPTLAALGVVRKEEGVPYTVPTIRSVDGSMITESAVIAAKLEELYPSPSLHLDAELQDEVDKVVRSIAMPLIPTYMPRIGREMVPIAGLEVFKTSREKRFGMSLDQLEKTQGGEQAWEAAGPGFQAMRDLLVKHKIDEGPFIKGSSVCYADFAILAMLESFRKVGVDLHERMVGQDASFQRLYDAGKQWTERDG